jgi:predicted DNA-binding helix-hairpin-helix protein
VNRSALSLSLVSALLAGGHYLASRPPAWLDEDPLLRPFGVSTVSDGQFDTIAVEEWPVVEAAKVQFPLDVNAASATELIALPGVGPVLAARIVAHRDSLHGLTGLSELDAVQGIGPASLARLAPLLSFGEFVPPTSSAAHDLQNANGTPEGDRP